MSFEELHCFWQACIQRTWRPSQLSTCKCIRMQPTCTRCRGDTLACDGKAVTRGACYAVQNSSGQGGKCRWEPEHRQTRVTQCRHPAREVVERLCLSGQHIRRAWLTLLSRQHQAIGDVIDMHEGKPGWIAQQSRTEE